MNRLGQIKLYIMNILIATYSWYFRCKIKILKPNVYWGKNIKIFGRLLVSVDKSAILRIGNNVIFRSATKFNFVGISKEVSIHVGKNAELIIGDNTGLSGVSIYSSVKIVIGSHCNIGGNVSIWDTDFHPIDAGMRRITLEGTARKAITLGDDVFIGANCMILKGVNIGDRSVVGAGSVVTKDIPSDEIWAGNPAKFIKTVSTC